MIHSEIRAPDCVGRGRAQSLGSVYFTYIAALKSHFATARQRFIKRILTLQVPAPRAPGRGGAPPRPCPSTSTPYCPLTDSLTPHPTPRTPHPFAIAHWHCRDRDAGDTGSRSHNIRNWLAGLKPQFLTHTASLTIIYPWFV